MQNRLVQVTKDALQDHSQVIWMINDNSASPPTTFSLITICAKYTWLDVNFILINYADKWASRNVVTHRMTTGHYSGLPDAGQGVIIASGQLIDANLQLSQSLLTC